MLARLEMQGRVKIRRYAGASSGAQTPFQIVLYGESGVIDRHLAYGILCDKYIPTAGTVRRWPLPRSGRSGKIRKTIG